MLIDKNTGQIFPEYGPNMMWNLKYGHGGMMTGPGGMMGPMISGWGGMGLGMGLTWILIIVGLFLLFGYGRTETREDRARNIARERLARGEITKEEFEEILKVL
jgi:uncharacterized membrane protein